ncbi:MAG: hypothetical protein AAF368_08180, partial [Planctomycetota bacterium]
RAESASERLEQAVRDFAQAEATILAHDKTNDGHTTQLAKAEAGLKKVGELRHTREIDDRNFRDSDAKLQQWQNTLAAVAELETAVASLSQKLQPATERATQLADDAKAKKQALAKAETALEKLDASVGHTRDETELASAWVALFDARARSEELATRRDGIEALVKNRKKHEADLSALPAIDASQLKQMRDIASGLAKAEAVLKATSTGIEVIRSSETVRAGDTSLTEGSEHVIDRETLLTVGDSLELRITPGGGTGLEAARRDVTSLRERLDELLSSIGIESADDAATILTKRQEISSRIGEVKAELAGRDADTVATQSDEAAHHLVAAEAEVKRRSAKHPDFKTPADAKEATERFQALRIASEKSVAEIATAKANRKAATDALDKAETASERAAEASLASAQELADLRTRLATKSEPLGTAENRDAEEKRLRAEHESAQTKLDATRDKLAALQPETLEADVKRLTRAIENSKADYESAIGRRAAARSVLHSDGTTDPASDLATARARLESATERHASLARRAEAIRLLRDKFAAEQQKLSDRFSRPLAEKVTSYLQPLFGPDATATVSVEDGTLGDWSMSRHGGAFEFEKLSGG